MKELTEKQSKNKTVNLTARYKEHDIDVQKLKAVAQEIRKLQEEFIERTDKNRYELTERGSG